MGAIFGTAGVPDEFYEQKLKAAIQAPGFLARYGLDAYEYQCGRGVNISEEGAKALGEKAKKHNITLSIHSPYFISLSSTVEATRLKSIDYILQCAKAAKNMGAQRIVVHSGSCGKIKREEALKLACDTLNKARAALDDNGYENILICPETMGKINQLGNVEEVIKLCKTDERNIPTIDFGHLNARTLGGIKTVKDYEIILDKFENELGTYRTSIFHAHFSKIEYTSGGEKCHLTFEDNTFGPDYKPLMELIGRRNYSPTIICESAGTQAKDAFSMKNYYILLQKQGKF